MTNTVPLIHLVRHRQLKFFGHILRMSKEESARRYALYIPTIGKRRPGRLRTSYLTLSMYKDCSGIVKEQCKNSRLPHWWSSYMEKPSGRLLRSRWITMSHILCLGNTNYEAKIFCCWCCTGQLGLCPGHCGFQQGNVVGEVQVIQYLGWISSWTTRVCFNFRVKIWCGLPHKVIN